MIPIKFLSKMGIYDIKIQGATVKVRVVNVDSFFDQQYRDLVDLALSELRTQIGATTVVGLMVKYDGKFVGNPSEPLSRPPMLLLCVGSRCLVVMLSQFLSIPKCLRDFLADQEICFVGSGMSRALANLKHYYGLGCTSGVEVGDLAARVLKKPKLMNKNGELVAISKIAAESGVPLEEPAASAVSIDLSARVFSHEEIDYVIRDVYASYKIGSELLGSL